MVVGASVSKKNSFKISYIGMDAMRSSLTNSITNVIYFAATVLIIM